MSLPETSSSDLWAIGLSPEQFKNEVNRLYPGTIEGDVVGFFLPPEGYNGDSNVHRARNYLKSDWTLAETFPPHEIRRSNFDQKYPNFDNPEPRTFQYSHSISTTTGNDYSQTKSWDVGVNASIPLGQSGAMIGFTANLSASEIHSKSSTKTESHDVTFAVDVPAGQGRKVTEATVETSTDLVWEARIAPRGAVGVEVDPAWWKPNYHVWVDNIESWFPNLSASSRIRDSRLDTLIDTKIESYTVENKQAVGFGLLEYRMHVDSRHVKPSDPYGDSEKQVVHVAHAEDPRVSSARPDAAATQPVRLDFHGQVNPVPAANRVPRTNLFKFNIYTNTVPGSITRPCGPTAWTPNPTVADTGRFNVYYENTVLAHPALRAYVIQQARSVAWGGGYLLTFT